MSMCKKCLGLGKLQKKSKTGNNFHNTKSEPELAEYKEMVRLVSKN